MRTSRLGRHFVVGRGLWEGLKATSGWMRSRGPSQFRCFLHVQLLTAHLLRLNKSAFGRAVVFLFGFVTLSLLVRLRPVQVLNPVFVPFIMDMYEYEGTEKKSGYGLGLVFLSSLSLFSFQLASIKGHSEKYYGY